MRARPTATGQALLEQWGADLVEVDGGKIPTCPLIRKGGSSRTQNLLALDCIAYAYARARACRGVLSPKEVDRPQDWPNA